MDNTSSRHPDCPRIDPATRWADGSKTIDGPDMRCVCGSKWPCLMFYAVLGYHDR